MLFLFVPFRAKNPPVVFPYVTVGLIVFNVVAYALTSHNFLWIEPSALETMGLSHHHFTVSRLLTHLFLHGNLLHLLGNMLFLWVFGGAVEGRIGWRFFLPFYLAAGMMAAMAQDAVNGALAPDMPMVGASGAIMSLLGAYLWLSPHAHILVAYAVGYGLKIRTGVTTWEARWLILAFILVDIVEGFFFRDSGLGGTANFAHLGGMLAGYLLVRVSRMTPESADFSKAQAIRTDFGGNYTIMNLEELAALVNGPQPTPEAILAYCRRALERADGDQKAAAVMTRNTQLILEKGDPIAFAELALDIPAHSRLLPSSFFFLLAEPLEARSWFELATRLYRRVTRNNETTPEAEVALLRLAKLLERIKPDKKQAAAVYTEQLRLFPRGVHAQLAQQALARLPQPDQPYSARNGEFGATGEVYAPGEDEASKARALYLVGPPSASKTKKSASGSPSHTAQMRTGAVLDDDLKPLPAEWEA